MLMRLGNYLICNAFEKTDNTSVTPSTFPLSVASCAPLVLAVWGDTMPDIEEAQGMTKATKSKLQPWVEEQRRHHLTAVQVQMARELGLNPKKFGKLANHRQEPWKAPLLQFIEQLYAKRFKRSLPLSISAGSASTPPAPADGAVEPQQSARPPRANTCCTRRRGD